jgi:hypothetical protein
MGPFKFVDLILGGRAIDLYNFSYLRRDYTFVDDNAEGIVRVYCSCRIAARRRDEGPMRLRNIASQSKRNTKAC